jgi:hypothetical protein
MPHYSPTAPFTTRWKWRLTSLVILLIACGSVFLLTDIPLPDALLFCGGAVIFLAPMFLAFGWYHDSAAQGTLPPRWVMKRPKLVLFGAGVAILTACITEEFFPPTAFGVPAIVALIQLGVLLAVLFSRVPQRPADWERIRPELIAGYRRPARH